MDEYTSDRERERESVCFVEFSTEKEKREFHCCFCYKYCNYIPFFLLLIIFLCWTHYVRINSLGYILSSEYHRLRSSWLSVAFIFVFGDLLHSLLAR